MQSKDQKFTTNASKHLIDQSEEKILQIDQSKNTSKHLQHHVDRILKLFIFNTRFFIVILYLL